MGHSRTTARMAVVEDGRMIERDDHLASEEPMEIRLSLGGETRRVAITMRTPGRDFELAAGFLFGEGVIARREDVARIDYCSDDSLSDDERYNVVTVDLAPGVLPDLRPLERHFFTSSACGVCGKASLEALSLKGAAAIHDPLEVKAPTIQGLPDALRSAQGLFDSTGGLHAAGLFTGDGRVVAVREDVGRHNAVDKVVGDALLQGAIPLRSHILMVSGRASYEILQKALAAQLPVVCAVSAPSSLAVELAQRFGITLVGFLRDRRFNVYSVPDRIRL